ncbi:DUF981 domain-containing protein [Leptolyngbya sp. NM3-A1]
MLITWRLGILFVGTSLALALGWELLTLGIYGFFVGLVSLVRDASSIWDSHRSPHFQEQALFSLA